jgi:hypothetical protein
VLANVTKFLLDSARAHGWTMRRVVMLALLIGAALAYTGAQSVLAGAEQVNGPPTFVGYSEGVKIVNVNATSAIVEAKYNPGSSETLVTFEYSTSETSSWSVGESFTEQPSSEGNQNASFGHLRHLSPATHYYARVKIKNAYGEAQETVQFTTSAIGPPEVYGEPGSPLCVVGDGGSCGEGGGNTARFGFQVYTGGTETSWSVEYSNDKSKLEAGEGIPVPGATGTITVAEEEVSFKGSLSGLTPETTYYLRIKATNKVATVAPILKFVTNGQPKSSEAEGRVEDIAASSAHVIGSVSAKEQETQWRFEYATVKEAEAGHWTVGPGGTIPAITTVETEPAKVEADLSGLSPATSYYVRLFAENTYGQSASSEYLGFQTVGPSVAITFPAHAIHGESVRPLGSVSLSVTPGDTTRYHFDYVPKAEYEQSGFAHTTAAPEVGLAGGKTEVIHGEVAGHPLSEFAPVTEVVGEDLPGLKPGETYFDRLVATNSGGTVEGAVETVHVPDAAAGGEESCPNAGLRTGASAALPSCRAYEQVTPVDKQGATDIFTWGIGGDQDKAWAGEDGNHVLFDAPLTKFGSQSGVLGGGYVFAREAGGHWRTDSLTPQPETGFNAYQILAQGLYNPDFTMLGMRSEWVTVTSDSPTQTLMFGPSGGPYSQLPSMTPSSSNTNSWAGASEDFHTLVVKTTDRKWCTGHATPTASGDDLYEWVEGACRQLNVDSTGKTIGSCGARLAVGSQEVGQVQEGSGPHAVSADGSRVFFTSVAGSVCTATPDLYMRVGGRSTTDIGQYEYLGANSEGTGVLVAKPGGEGYEFLLYETETGVFKHLFSAHTSLLVGAGTSGAAAYTFVSEDLSTIYLGIGNGLYRYDIGGAKLHFLFDMTPERSAHNTDFNGPFMSPDGRFFYWLSRGNPGIPAPEKHLNRDGSIGNGGEPQLYRYDSLEESVECVSCASPYDPEPLLEAITENADLQRGDNSVDGVPRIRIASDDGGRVFFVTAAKLVPQDINGEAPLCTEGLGCEYPNGSPSYDVYEWRRPGLNGCGRVEGCITLISGGREGLRTQLIGTTPSGDDVFFATHEALVPQDTDTAGDIYDARIGGGEPPPPPRPTECEGDACSSPFAAPTDLTPASLAFQGAGNTTTLPAKSSGKTVRHAIKKHKKKRRARGQRRSGVKHAGRSGAGRRVGSARHGGGK